MQALKGLVVGLGMLIVISFGLLLYGFVTKMGGFGGTTQPEAPATASDVASTPAAPVAGFGVARVALPEGCHVEEMRPDGGRLYLRLGPQGTCERIIVVDATSGRRLGDIRLEP